MDSQNEHEELSQLKHQQERLQGELSGLSQRLSELESRLGTSDVVAEPPAVVRRRTPPPVPELAKPKAERQKAVAQEHRLSAPTVPVLHQSEAKVSEPDPPKLAKPTGDWELNLGRVWFVRAGVGLLLTGLVFLSLYAYQNWIFAASAAVKVSFFFAISLAMVFGGYFIERRREALRQYGQVLSAGGLAAGYYTLYAAHFVPALKVIGSPVLVAVLLCLWAAGMLTYAAWRRGRILAVMSIGLAYYATVVNPSGWVSLFSSLVLSAAAMILLMRFRWVWVGAVGLIAAYVSHAFWLGLMPHEATEPVRITYLSCTWLLFALAMQVAQCQSLKREWRRALLGLNNTAFWALLVFEIPEMRPHEHIGWISIGIGMVWMLIAALSWKRGGWRREYVILWGFQGLLIATLGLMIEASGYSRFLMLSCEACILLAAASWIAPKWTRLAAILCYAASVVFALLEGIEYFGEIPSWPGYLFTALFGFGFVALMRRDVENAPKEEVAAVYGKQHQLAPLAFAWIPWVVLIYGAMLRWDANWTLIGLCGAPLLAAASRVLSNRREPLDIALTSPLAMAAAGIWILDGQDVSTWAYAVAALLVATYWLISLQLRKSFKDLSEQLPLTRSHWIEWIAAIVLGLALFRGVNEGASHSQVWLTAAPLIAIAGSLVYLLTRRHSLAVVLGLFYILALLELWSGSRYSTSSWGASMPFLLMVAHLAMIERYFKTQRIRGLRAMASAAITIAFAGLVVIQHWEHPELWTSLLAALWLAFGFWRKDATATVIGGMIPLAFISMASLVTRDPDSWSAYLYLALLPAAALLVRPLKLSTGTDWASFRQISGVLGILLLGIKLSAHVLQAFDGSGLAICWGLYAVLLFAIGLYLADRLFRRFGLCFLLIALIHILLVDVMKLDTLGRILSFLTLGAVLLLLGFLYNQFHEKIRKYL